jgi:hypothetical protein
MSRVVLRGVLFAVVACGGMPAVPGKGGPAWFELTSPHFTVWTDTSPQRARELVRQMERLRQVIAGMVFPGVPDAARGLVIAVRDDAEFEATWSGVGRAYARPAGPPLWQPVIVLPAFSNDRDSEMTVTHELTHAISHAAIPRQPRWLAEGMAKYFETVQLDADSETVDVGTAPSIRGERMRMPHLLSVSKLFAWKELRPGFEVDSEYSTAWALFTYLMNEHRAELVRYLQGLADLDPAKGPWDEQAERAWREAFPSSTPAVLDSELRQWLINGRHLVLHLRVRPQVTTIEDRTLSDADVYAIRGLLYSVRDKARERENVAAALAAEPTCVLARLLAHDLDAAAQLSPAEARAITAAHGDDWRAWWLQAYAISATHGDPADLQVAATQACTLLAENPAVVAPPGLCPNGVRAGAERP